MLSSAVEGSDWSEAPLLGVPSSNLLFSRCFKTTVLVSSYIMGLLM